MAFCRPTIEQLELDRHLPPYNPPEYQRVQPLLGGPRIQIGFCRPTAPTAPGQHAHVALGGTCSVLSSLHPRKEWSLHLSRGASLGLAERPLADRSPRWDGPTVLGPPRPDRSHDRTGWATRPPYPRMSSHPVLERPDRSRVAEAVPEGYPLAGPAAVLALACRPYV